jgi:hypothetical protein
MRRLFRAWLRRIDLQILWPRCKARASDLNHAKAAFAMHVLNDEAWTSLGIPELMKRIDSLD